MVYCQYCGMSVLPNEPNCPSCGMAVMPFQPFSLYYPPRPFGHPYFTWKPIVSGILLLIAAIWCLVDGILVFIYTLDGWYYYDELLFVIIVVMEFWGFSIGLLAAILILKRTKFPISVIGTSFVLVSGCIAFFPITVIGIIILPLAILGTIFLGLSKTEFDLSPGQFQTPIPGFETPRIQPKFTTGHNPKTESTSSIAQQLRELKGLFDDEIINETEYEEKRKKLLEKL